MSAVIIYESEKFLVKKITVEEESKYFVKDKKKEEGQADFSIFAEEVFDHMFKKLMKRE